MVSNEDFKFFKEFIATHYQREVMDDTEEKILAAILTIESNGQLNEIVQANLVTSKSDQTAKLQP
jgi:hypothetical protein